jgi:hypothetical protein
MKSFAKSVARYSLPESGSNCFEVREDDRSCCSIGVRGYISYGVNLGLPNRGLSCVPANRRWLTGEKLADAGPLNVEGVLYSEEGKEDG